MSKLTTKQVIDLVDDTVKEMRRQCEDHFEVRIVPQAFKLLDDAKKRHDWWWTQREHALTEADMSIKFRLKK